MMYLGKDAVGLATSLPVFSDIAKIECGNYTPTEDEDTNSKYILHSLGAIPDFFIFFADLIELPEEYTKMYIVSGSMIKRNIINDSYDTRLQISIIQPNEPHVTNAGGNGIMSNYHTDTQFKFVGPANSYLKANITYHWMIGKFKEVTSNASE